MTIPDGSYSMMPHWLLDRDGIGRTEFAVYFILDSYAHNETRRAWPSINTITDKLGITHRKAVRDALARLSEQGIIDIEHRFRGDKGAARSSNLYVVHRESPEARGIISDWTPREKAARMISGEAAPEDRTSARRALLAAMESGESPVRLLYATHEVVRRGWRVTDESLAACRRPQAA